MWFLWRMLRFSWTAKKSNKTVLRVAETTRSLIYRISKGQVTFGHVMRRETGTSCDNWNDQSRMQQGKATRKYVGWTMKVAKCRSSGMKVMIAYAKEQGT